MTETVRTFLQNQLNLNAETQAKLLDSLIIILVLVLLRFILLQLINRRIKKDPRALYSWRKMTEYTIVVIGIFLIGRLWLEGIQSLATYLGLVSAGLAIALQDLIVNLAGWGFIIWRWPFVVGDRIELGSHSGDVVDIRIFSFSLLEIAGRIDAEQSTGRVIHIPNGKVFREPIANYSQGLAHIWNEIPITVTFESDWQKAKTLLEQLLNKHTPRVEKESKAYGSQSANRFVIAYDNIAPTVYTKVVSSGVLLTLRYLIAPKQRRNSEQEIWEAVLRAFGQQTDIDFAYDTVRQYRKWEDGKATEAAQEQGSSTDSNLENRGGVND